MIAAIARHEWRRRRNGLTFWLLLAFAQLLVAWLAFAQLEAFASIAPQLKAGAATIGTTDLVIVPTFNSLLLILLLAAPLLAMGGLADETHSGRIALWLSAPAGSGQIAAGKVLGLWFTLLPLVASASVTLGLLGLGIDIDVPRFLLAVAGLSLLSLWLACVVILLSGLVQHPIAALALSYGVLLFIWLLDSFGGAEAPWYAIALLPHSKPLLLGLLRSQDLVYFLATGLAAVLLTAYLLDRRRGLV